MCVLCGGRRERRRRGTRAQPALGIERRRAQRAQRPAVVSAAAASQGRGAAPAPSRSPLRIRRLPRPWVRYSDCPTVALCARLFRVLPSAPPEGPAVRQLCAVGMLLAGLQAACASVRDFSGS